MHNMAETTFELHHIRCCGAKEEKELSPEATASTTVHHSTSGSSYTTEVLLKLGAPTFLASTGRFSHADSPTLMCYMCPAYILQAGCPALRELLLDAFQGDSSEVRGVDNETGMESAAALVLPSSLPPVSIDLSFLGRDVFEVVAVYLEHFYALDYSANTTTTTSILSTPAQQSGTYLSPSSARTPSPLRRPLNFEDLYALSTWEHYYVLCQLLGLARSRVDSLRLAECGAWVDLLGDAAAPSSSEGEMRRKPRVAVEHDAGLSQQRIECFSLVNRQRMWSRLCQILEAALRLGMLSLRVLCATVAANMLVDLDASSLTQLMQFSGDDSSINKIPPFTAEAREQLLQRFPWLKLA
ncbi:hypothetical protein JKF63_04578 [Porcisia hertigi]|uniref:Uncharacterized protein n=1 Tax=Porcisia hertigi TaxID=2761500 RepID=A0A836IT31_9TRYP|nr:hypothetical protein JKF63_04578 [Porcisia hertigi]